MECKYLKDGKCTCFIDDAMGDDCLGYKVCSIPLVDLETLIRDNIKFLAQPEGVPNVNVTELAQAILEWIER